MNEAYGYSYTNSGSSFTTTDSTQAAPKPGEGLFVGETQPTFAQIGDLWINSTSIRRYDGSAWTPYYGAVGNSPIKSGTATFTGTSYAVTFSSPMATAPVVVVNPYNAGYGGVWFIATNITTTGFTIVPYDMESGNPKTGTYSVGWLASAQGINGSVQAGYRSGITDTNGYLSVTFPQAYTAPPVIVSSYVLLPQSYEPSYGIKNVTNTGFQFQAYTGDSNNPAKNAAVSFYWIATPIT